MDNLAVALKEMTMTVKEIHDRYFNDAKPIEDLPGVHCTGLLALSDDQTTHKLWLDLYWGWRSEWLLPATLWHCVWQLAVIVYSSHQIYLFTFDDLGSFETHLREIRACFHRC